MTSGKKARQNRNAAGGFKKAPKEATPWFMRNSLVLRKGRGKNAILEAPGTPVSSKRLEKIAKMWEMPVA